MMELCRNSGPRSFFSALQVHQAIIPRSTGHGGDDAVLFDMWWLLIVPIDDTNVT